MAEQSSPPKPELPLHVLEAIGETERKVKRLLEDCPAFPRPFPLVESEVAKATKFMRVCVSESFKTRADYYALQPGFCRAWLDEAADETVAATLDLAPAQFRVRYGYRDSVFSMKKDLWRTLQACIDEWPVRANDIDKQKDAEPARTAAPLPRDRGQSGFVYRWTKQDQEAADVGVNLLKQQPGWQRVGEQLFESDLQRVHKWHDSVPRSDLRSIAFRHFAFLAGTLLELVSDGETAEAYSRVLPLFGHGVYLTIEDSKPTNSEALTFDRSIQFRIRRWTAKAHQRAEEFQMGKVTPPQRYPLLRYRYPEDFPPTEQRAIEAARLNANRKLGSASVGSHEEGRGARTEWFWQIVTAAANAIGWAGVTQNWAINHTREMLLDFGLNAAEAAGIAGRGGYFFKSLCQTAQWQALDDVLLRPSPDTKAPRLPVESVTMRPEMAEGNLFQDGARKHPQLHARWLAAQKDWTFHDRMPDEEGNYDLTQSIPAAPEVVASARNDARIAIGRLRKSLNPEIRAAAASLRDSLFVWLDLMRMNDRGFRRIPQLRSWRGGKSMEEFQESGAIPPDAIMTENGCINQLFLESAAFWADVVGIGFEGEPATVTDQRKTPEPATTRATKADEFSNAADAREDAQPASLEPPSLPTPVAAAGTKAVEQAVTQRGKDRKGDATLLAGKRLVTFGTAEEYLGISDRQRQKLMNRGALKFEGQGMNRKITSESLLAYLPPDIPN